MIKDEVRFSLMCEISMALKSSKLQQEFEIICKNLSELEKENAELNDKLNNLASVADVRLGMWQKYEKENAELKGTVTKMNNVITETFSKLTEAKEIIQEYIRINLLPPIERNFDDEVKLFKQAEQFLKED